MGAKKTSPKKPAPRADYGKPIEAMFARTAPPLRAILAAVRRMVEEAVPGVESSLKWGNAVFCHPGSKAMMVALTSHKSHVNVVFVGPPKGFADPKGRLVGSGVGGRHLKLTSIDELPRADVKRWIKVSAAYARSKA